MIFLSEAFTKPKMMRLLAKIGFTQSYTYFTWRESAWELREYFTELVAIGDARVLPTERIHEHARHQPAPPRPRQAGLRDPHGARGDAVELVRDLLRWELCENARLDEREEYLD